MEKKDPYKKYSANYGEPVGVVAAQSIGEPGTQMILRSFHLAGIASAMATSGLPRLVELADARKRPSAPMVYIYLEDSIKNNFEKANDILKKISEVKLSDVVKRGIENFSKGEILFKLDMQALEANDLTPKEVAAKVGKLLEKDAGVENGILKILAHTKNVKEVRSLKVKAEGLTISGTPGASRATLQQDKNGEYYIISAGDNLEGIMKVEGVDNYRIYTNDVFEMYRTFGIEAARNTLVRELATLISDQGITIDQRHLQLLADAMCINGIVESVGRHGLTGDKESVFARASYEETVKHLINAAAFGEYDFMKGVTESVLIGKQIGIGTGKVRLAVRKEDLAKIAKKK
ncbi:MAG: DNA-directed RNA polymerase subunit A'' [Candidatus Micrarchaeia archaeon]